MKAFILHTFFNALIVSVGLTLMGLYLIIVGHRIKRRLYVAKTTAISGLIHSDQVQDPTNAKLM